MYEPEGIGADEFYLAAGNEVTLTRKVTESVVEAFTEVSGDHSPNHVDEGNMSQSVYESRIAHGALLIAFMSACSTAIAERIPRVRDTETPVSLGYDRITFIGPEFIGDTVNLRYRVREVDAQRRRARAEITVTNQHSRPVCIGEHILKWVS